MFDERKRCAKCESDLSTALFTKRANGRCYAYCKPCQSLLAHEYYIAQREQYSARRRESQRRYRRRNQEFVIQYLKEHPCIDCGESDPVMLEFDHVDSHAKDHNVSDLLRQAFSLGRIEREIERCLVRCGNCHRKRTAKQFGWNVT